MMTRVARGHTGRPLEADHFTTAIYLMITAAAVIRVAAEFAGAVSMNLLVASAALWVVTFGFFMVIYGRILILPRADVI